MPTAREQHFRTKHHRADARDILEEKKIPADKKRAKKQEPVRAWDLVYDVIVRSSIPVALSYMFLFYLGESKH